MSNLLSFDVEDWFHGLDIAPARWDEFAPRLTVGMEVILDLLARHGTHATFFVLGVVAQENPALVRQIVDAGHEVATHGWDHTPLYCQSPEDFRADLHAALVALRGVTGAPVLGHRAAFFSLTAATLWAPAILAEAGIAYDSSIFPVHNYRYGVPAAPRFPYRLLPSLVEYPISTLRLGGLNVPFSGGFYARFWPYAFLRWGVRMLNRQGQPAIVYFHPWEFDPAHPHLRGEAAWLARRTHYHGLARSRGVLAALLRDFTWGPLGDATDPAGSPR